MPLPSSMALFRLSGHGKPLLLVFAFESEWESSIGTSEGGRIVSRYTDMICAPSQRVVPVVPVDPAFLVELLAVTDVAAWTEWPACQFQNHLLIARYHPFIRWTHEERSDMHAE